jgi:hypothetical protein
VPVSKQQQQELAAISAVAKRTQETTGAHSEIKEEEAHRASN